MFIRAIGIYVLENTKGQETESKEKNSPYERINFATKEKPGFFSAPNPLDELEKLSLPKFCEKHQPNICNIYKTKEEGYHHLIDIPSRKLIVAIVTKTKIDQGEWPNLIHNILHAHLRPKTVKVSLDDIVKNPVGFTGKDIHIDKVQNKVDELKLLMNNIIEKATERGEQLEELKETTKALEESAIKFYKKAETLNSRCCW